MEIFPGQWKKFIQSVKQSITLFDEVQNLLTVEGELLYISYLSDTEFYIDSIISLKLLSFSGLGTDWRFPNKLFIHSAH